MPTPLSLDRLLLQATFFPGLNVRLGSLDATRKIIENQLQRILLLPNLEVTMNRLKARDGSTDHFERAIRFVHQAIETRPELLTGWHVVDSSELNVEETVDCILERTGIRISQA